MKLLLLALGIGLAIQTGLIVVNLEKAQQLIKKNQDKVERAFKELNR